MTRTEATRCTSGSVCRSSVRLVTSEVALPGEIDAAVAEAWGGTPAVALGQAYDGIIWGVVEGGVLTTAHAAGCFGAALRSETLVDLRVFGGGNRELRVFRSGASLRALMVTETPAESTQGNSRDLFDAWIERVHPLLRGDADSTDSDPTGTSRRFVQLWGTAGEEHWPPREALARPALRVRRYLRADGSGMLRFAAHRIVGLAEWGEKSS